MMRFIPTMNFNGQCSEAMEMYRKAFGGKIYPLQSTFYSSARVVFVDRFGIRWGIMTETAE